MKRFSIITITALSAAVMCSACTSTRIVHKAIAVPTQLTEPVLHPIKPSAHTATQKDVAVYLIQQHEALQLCNAQLQTIKTWSDTWTSSTKQK